MELTMEQCCERLENMDDIAVLCHRNPDGDTLGCAFALKYMLEQLGKRVQVKSHDGFPKQYSYMYRGFNGYRLFPLFQYYGAQPCRCRQNDCRRLRLQDDKQGYVRD